ncbi:MAG: NAD(+)/NADH kinase [Thermoplasmata archaeon]|jgi:NAD kinase|nr:NAD(+)/NADH kinase [Thermoplasmata archaeon]
MNLRRVLLSTKKTALEYFKEHTDFLEDALQRRELAEIRTRHDAHYESLDRIRRILTERGIHFSRSYMPYSEYEDFRGKDLIISVGGDGTVLNSSQYVMDRTPMLTVRSDRKSAGVLCMVDAQDFERAIDRIIEDEFEVQDWTRVEGRFGSRRLFALNEVFVGARHSPSMARYEIAHDGRTESQMSSGVVITTGTGSTGWYANIPGSGGSFPRTAKELRFIVREHNLAGDYRLTEGTIEQGGSLTVRSKMNVDGCISFDGDYGKRMFEFKRGSLLRVKAARLPVRVVSVNGRRSEGGA